MPAFALAGPVGPFRVPGLEGDGLYGALFSGAIARQWLTFGATPFTEGVHGGPYWPASPMGALLQALLPVDPAFALGLVVAFAWWLAGYGPFRLARVLHPDTPAAACLAAGVAAQTSAVMLRALPGADLAAMAIGPIALGLAHPWTAWLGGLWSLPGAVVFATAGAGARRLPWLLAGLPLLALQIEPSALPGAFQSLPGPSAASPAYVSANGAVFPFPPSEAASLVEVAERTSTGLWIAPGLEPTVRGTLHRGPVPAPGGPPTLPGGQAPDPPPPAAQVDDRPAAGALLVPLQRLYGGPVVLIGLVLAVVTSGLGSRIMGAAGLGTLAVITLLYGWQAAPGELEADPTIARTLLLALEADVVATLPGGAAAVSSWAAIVVALGTPGLAWVVGRVWAVGLLAVLGIPLENPRLAAPVVSFPPDPLVDTLARVDAGGVLLFPAAAFPYLQGQRPTERWLWEMALAQRGTDDGGGESAVAGLVRALTIETGIPVDVQAAEPFWKAGDGDPFTSARDAGWRYLVIDLAGLPEETRPRLDGWLAERVGTPVARDEGRLLYDLSGGPPGRDGLSP